MARRDSLESTLADNPDASLFLSLRVLRGSSRRTDRQQFCHAVFEIRDTRDSKIWEKYVREAPAWRFTWFYEIYYRAKNWRSKSMIRKKVRLSSFNWTIKVAIRRPAWSNGRYYRIRRSNHWPWFKNIILLRSKSDITIEEDALSSRKRLLSRRSFDSSLRRKKKIVTKSFRQLYRVLQNRYNVVNRDFYKK